MLREYAIKSHKTTSTVNTGKTLHDSKIFCRIVFIDTKIHSRYTVSCKGTSYK